MAVNLRSNQFSETNIKQTFYQDFYDTSLFNEETRDINLLTNDDCVKKSILNILLTKVGERKFNPTFGSEINKLLFENFSLQTTNSLNNLIKLAIQNFEPRARIVDIISTPIEDANMYAVTIIFRTINTIEPLRLEFFLNRTR